MDSADLLFVLDANMPTPKLSQILGGALASPDLAQSAPLAPLPTGNLGAGGSQPLQLGALVADNNPISRGVIQAGQDAFGKPQQEDSGPSLFQSLMDKIHSAPSTPNKDLKDRLSEEFEKRKRGQ